ncbi:hypothetical protein HK098_003391 [Nowakowskiella sp. JEL0407]|nr:hypothetical protein HK098_003385 [Nowakowskiella sp. JEL0407]KAJ3128848.1 hypothetical protein HK098_003391 [Nowakowskiella sp. JEL0407]
MPRSVSLEKGESTYSNDGIAPKSKSNTFFGMNEEGKGEQSEGSVKVETQANKKLVSPLNQTEVEAMRKALERGVLPVKRMKIVLVGEGRAGKTSLLRALRDLEFRKDEESTVYVNPVEVEQHFLENWEEGKKYGQLLKSVQSSLGISTPKRRSSGISKLAKQVPRLFPTAVSSQPNSSNDDFVSLHKQKYPVSRSESKSIVKRLEDMHISSKSAQYPTKDDFNSTTMTIYDFAGQNRYSVFQQIFITAQAIYLVIFRLDSMFLRDGNGLNQSELRVVLSWLNTIQLRVPESKIFLIATQCDKSQSYNLPLLESFIPSTIKQLIVPNEQAGVRDSLIFVTSAKTKKGIKDLREAIDKVVQQCVSELEQKPVDWIQFQDKIADLILEKKTPLTYRMEEMMKIAHEFRITDRKELDAVLRYFHNIGVVLYFPKNSQLRRVVFPNPQAVVNVVSEVFRYHDNPSSIREVSRHNLQALEELITNKVWMRSLLDELWGKHLSTNEVASLFALLKEFDLLCDIKPLTLDSKTTNIAHNTISVMPCLLPDEFIKVKTLFDLSPRS